MTILQAKKAIEVERKILGLIRELPDRPENWTRITFQIARISELEGFVIHQTLAEQSPTSEAEQGPVPEPPLLLEPEPQPQGTEPNRS